MTDKREIIFPLGKKIYKGNLHSHTTRSDGFYSLEKLVEGYKRRGYQFLCISDHNRYYYSTIKDNEDFIILDGMEGNTYDGSRHIHVIADYSVETDNRYPADVEIPRDKELSLEETVERYRSHGNICIFNHPHWSQCAYDDMLRISDCLGIEVYNTACEVVNTAYSIDYWDYGLQRGKKIFAFATDDAHASDMEAEVSTYFGGWISVAGNELTQSSIVDNIKKGNFYSSTGPEFHRIEREGNTITVFTSPVQSIRFVFYPGRGVNIYAPDAKNISTASLRLPDNISYLRIEAVDKYKRTAWSNPIYFNA